MALFLYELKQRIDIFQLSYKHVCSTSTYADNVCGTTHIRSAHAALLCTMQSISPASWATAAKLQQQHAAARWDRETYGWMPDSSIDLAPRTVWAVPIIHL